MILNTLLKILRLCKVFSRYILQVSHLETEDGLDKWVVVTFENSELSQLFKQQLISSWLAVVNESNTPVAHRRLLSFKISIKAL